MRRLRAKFDIVHSDDKIVAILDKDDSGMSVTNDVEAVVEYLYLGGALKPGMRLIYCDTMGGWDEIRYKGSKFTDFRLIGARTLAAAIARVS